MFRGVRKTEGRVKDPQTPSMTGKGWFGGGQPNFVNRKTPGAEKKVQQRGRKTKLGTCSKKEIKSRTWRKRPQLIKRERIQSRKDCKPPSKKDTNHAVAGRRKPEMGESAKQGRKGEPRGPS